MVARLRIGRIREVKKHSRIGHIVEVKVRRKKVSGCKG